MSRNDVDEQAGGYERDEAVSAMLDGKYDYIRMPYEAEAKKVTERDYIHLKQVNKDEMIPSGIDAPSYNEWLQHDMTQQVMRDIYDTLVVGANKRPFWSYVVEATQGKFERQKAAVFRHMLRVHESSGHAIDKDDGKPHLANALARAFMARGMQIDLLAGRSMATMEEARDE